MRTFSSRTMSLKLSTRLSLPPNFRSSPENGERGNKMTFRYQGNFVVLYAVLYKGDRGVSLVIDLRDTPEIAKVRKCIFTPGKKGREGRGPTTKPEKGGWETREGDKIGKADGAAFSLPHLFLDLGYTYCGNRERLGVEKKLPVVRERNTD